MGASRESSVEEVERLRLCLNHLVGIMALPSLWNGGGSQNIAGTLMDALLGMLRPAFVFVRLNDSDGGFFTEIARVAVPLEGADGAEAIGRVLDGSLGEWPREWPSQARLSIQGADFVVASARLGIDGEIGIAVVGSQRTDFPQQTERLVLDVAANQAAIGLQQERKLAEQKRVARELDERVAQRTRELAAANERLKKSESESRLIVDSIPGLVAVANVNGEIQSVSRPVLDYYGKSLEELRQWATGDTIHPADRPGLMQTLTQSMTTGNPIEFEARVRRFDGVYRWFQIRGSALRDRQGRVFRWYFLHLDIDDRKRAEEALKVARSELAHVSRVTSLSALAASIAHEVNQPLSGIITNAGTCLRMLNADPPNIDGARETVRRTIRDGNRAADVIARLRALFSKREFTVESLDLNEAAKEVIALSLNDLQRNQVIVQTELADDLPGVAGDRIQLQQVVLNLLRNASDAMAEIHDRPRRLLIRTECPDDRYVRLSVQDSGVGFEGQIIDRLFDSFYTTKSGGMGIGLSVSRSIIERHRGRLWAEANDGPGATFSFAVPCGSEMDPAPPESES